MLTIPPAKAVTKRSPKPRLAVPAPTPPVMGPVLVSASYSPASSVLLVFDRAIDVKALEPSVIVIVDGQYEMLQLIGASEYELYDGVNLRIFLSAQWEAAPGPVTLSAPGTTGIVDATDGTPWAGVVGVGLPFP